MTSDRLMTRASALSVAIRPSEPVGVEARLGKRALALDETLLGPRTAEDSAILSGFRLLAFALLRLSRSTQIDDLSHERAYFFRKASIDTTFVSPTGSVGFPASRADFGAEARSADGLTGVGLVGVELRVPFSSAAADASDTRGSSLNPNGTDGSVNPVIESNGTVNRSGLREKFRLTSNAS